MLVHAYDEYDLPAENGEHYTEVKRVDGPLYQVTRMTSTQMPAPPPPPQQQVQNHYSIHTSSRRADHVPTGHITSAVMSVNNAYINQQPAVSEQRNAYLSNATLQTRPEPQSVRQEDVQTTRKSREAPVHISKVFHKTDDMQIIPEKRIGEVKRSTAHIQLQQSEIREAAHEDLGRYINEDEFGYEVTQDETEDDYDAACDIVRGSFLIKNAIDTTSPAKTLDVVEPDDEGEGLVVDDNVNLFHTRYLTNRENPLYDSNPDLSKIDEYITDSKPEHVLQQNINETHFVTTDNGVPMFVQPEVSHEQFTYTTNRSNDVPPHKYISRIDTTTYDNGPSFGTGYNYGPEFETTTHIRPEYETTYQHRPECTTTRTIDEYDSPYIPRYSSTRTDSYVRQPPPSRSRGVYEYSYPSRSRYSSRYHSDLGDIGSSRRGPQRASRYGGRYGGAADPTSSSWYYRSEYGQNAPNADAASVAGSINTEMEMNMGKGMFRTKHPPNELFSDGEETYEEWDETTHENHDRPPNMERRNITREQLDDLLGKNLNDAIKQTINVDREEEEIHGDVLLEHADGSATTTDDLLNFDTITENVNLGIKDGTAEVQIKVRCERIVPMIIYENMFKKSSIIVTRNIQIDLEATDERKTLYKNILRGINKPMISNKAQNNWGFKKKSAGEDKTLTMRETFKVYKQLMGIADVDDPMSNQHDGLLTETRVEEEQGPVDEVLQSDMLPLSLKKPDDDAMSFMSAASNTADILF